MLLKIAIYSFILVTIAGQTFGMMILGDQGDNQTLSPAADLACALALYRWRFRSVSSPTFLDP